MKPIIDLIQRLSLNDPKLRYPEYAPDDGKIHLLYMGVPFNATGLYRCVIPAITLNTTGTHSVIINDMQDWHEHDRFRSQSLPITDQLIRWAHYIIFPTVFNKNEDFKYLIKEFQKLNPGIKIFIDVDDDIMHISPYHPNAKRYTQQFILNVIDNMNSCDGITCTHSRLCNWYEEWAGNPRYYALPNLMSKLTIPEGSGKNSKPFTIGITANNTQLADLTLLSRPLKNILKKFDDEISIYLFGWDGKHFNGRYFADAFLGVKHTHIKPVIITDYFTALQTLKYDIALMPLVDNAFNRMKSNHKLLQYAMLGIPVIAPDMPPYNEPAIPDRPPIPYLKVNSGEWEDNIELMLKTEIERNILASDAQKIVRENYFIEDNIGIWQECFA